MQTRSHLGHLLKRALFGHKLNALGIESAERASSKLKILAAERDVSKLARSKPLKPCNRLLLISGTRNLKHQTILATIYATGLRVSEMTALRVQDIDSSRQVILVRQGKGRKDRFVMLSPALLTRLRRYWQVYRPTTHLFAGDRPQFPISAAGIQ